MDLQKIIDAVEKGDMAIEAASALLPGISALIKLGVLTVKLLKGTPADVAPFEELAAQYDQLVAAIKMKNAAWREANPEV